MSRSRHSDPLHIRGPRRLGMPWASCGEGDRARLHAVARILKEQGLQAQRVPLPPAGTVHPPRIVVRPPSAGTMHVLEKGDVRATLWALGAMYWYKLRVVELCAQPADGSRRRLALGRLVVPGRILLLSLPPSPWHLPHRLPATEARRLLAAGALVETAAHSSLVAWAGSSLRRFMVCEVLCHELGHHLAYVRNGGSSTWCRSLLVSPWRMTRRVSSRGRERLSPSSVSIWRAGGGKWW